MNMTLAERIKLILRERHTKQVQFARALGISSNYTNLLVNGKKENISDTLAKLIEETYGYTAQWVKHGTGTMVSPLAPSAVKLEFIRKVRRMPDKDVAALLAFADALENVKKCLEAAEGDSDSDEQGLAEDAAEN